MQPLSRIRSLLQQRGLRPRTSLGQHFLIDHNLIRRLVDAAGPFDRPVLEVGPGTGALTEELLDRGADVVACEIDPGLADLLRDRYADHPRFLLVRGDCLQAKRRLADGVVAALAGRPFRLVANLPYSCATPLLLTLLIDHPECDAMLVTVQREVADRLAASPRTREYGLLSVVAQVGADVRTLATLGPECFWPRPAVDSAMVSIRRRAEVSGAHLAGVARVARALFAHRRKQIGKALASLGLSGAEGLTGSERAEDLPPDVYARLAQAIAPDRA